METHSEEPTISVGTLIQRRNRLKVTCHNKYEAGNIASFSGAWDRCNILHSPGREVHAATHEKAMFSSAVWQLKNNLFILFALKLNKIF